MKAEESLVYSFYVLFLISFMGSWEMLFAAGLLIIIGFYYCAEEVPSFEIVAPGASVHDFDVPADGDQRSARCKKQ